jgi:hypothetical protein
VGGHAGRGRRLIPKCREPALIAGDRFLKIEPFDRFGSGPG